MRKREAAWKRGLELIETALEAARRQYSAAQAEGNREALAKRELRYWSARRASANVVHTAGTDNVQFGSVVMILRDDGREQTFRIVGEDETNPKGGFISHVLLLARSLTNKRVGDTIGGGKGEAEIIAIK